MSRESILFNQERPYYPGFSRGALAPRVPRPARGPRLEIRGFYLPVDFRRAASSGEGRKFVGGSGFPPNQRSYTKAAREQLKPSVYDAARIEYWKLLVEGGRGQLHPGRGVIGVDDVELPGGVRIVSDEPSVGSPNPMFRMSRTAPMIAALPGARIRPLADTFGDSGAGKRVQALPLELAQNHAASQEGTNDRLPTRPR